MIKYPNIEESNAIGITAISDGANERIDLVIAKLKEQRKQLILSKKLRESSFQTSASAEERAKEFIEMWLNSQIGHIISVFGGEFCMEVLEYLHTNKHIFLEKGKWFQGFSDASFINFYLTTNYNIPTIHCYNAEDYGMAKDIDKLVEFIHLLPDLKPGYSFKQNIAGTHIKNYLRSDVESDLYKTQINILNGEVQAEFSGRLIGGWIEALATICGTKYDNTVNFCNQFPEGMIWYIDNCELTSPMFRRKLWQLKESSYFKNCNGVLIGRQPHDDFTGQYDYLKALHDSFDSLEIPVISGVDIGHFFPQWLLINGSYANVQVNKNKVKILQKLR